MLDGSNLDKVKAFLDDRMQDLVQNTYVDKSGLFVELKNAEMKNKLMSSLAGESFDIDKFYVYEPSLNDIFVEYTED